MDLCLSLIQKGARINCEEEEWGYTPLIQAIAGHHFAIAEWLMNHGADVNVKTRNGDTPIKDLCIRNGDDPWDGRKVAEMVIEKLNDKESRLSEILTKESYNREICEWLISKGADVDAVDNHLNTPLIKASRNGDRQIAELLISKDAKIDHRNEDGQNALIFASERGHKEIVELLLNNGANIKAKDNKGKTAMNYAREKGFIEIEEILKSKRVSLISKLSRHFGATRIPG